LPKKLTIKEIQDRVNQFGVKCLSTKYENSRIKLLFECDQGHQWYALYYNARCVTCNAEKRKEEKLEKVRETAASRGGKCLSNKYETKLLFECDQGHQWRTTYHCIEFFGTWCKICSSTRYKKLLEKEKPITPEMQEIPRSRGGRCVSETYTHLSRKLQWECEYKHRWMDTFHSIKKGSWCKKCEVDGIQEIMKIKESGLEITPSIACKHIQCLPSEKLVRELMSKHEEVDLCTRAIVIDLQKIAFKKNITILNKTATATAIFLSSKTHEITKTPKKVLGKELDTSIRHCLKALGIMRPNIDSSEARNLYWKQRPSIFGYPRAPPKKRIKINRAFKKQKKGIIEVGFQLQEEQSEKLVRELMEKHGEVDLCTHAITSHLNYLARKKIIIISPSVIVSTAMYLSDKKHTLKLVSKILEKSLEKSIRTCLIDIGITRGKGSRDARDLYWEQNPGIFGYPHFGPITRKNRKQVKQPANYLDIILQFIKKLR
jgi:hypothetical protein